MTAFVLALALAALLFCSGWAGPALLQRAAPALMRTPRMSVRLLGAGIVIWIAAALSLGPLLAWAGTGPQLLPQSAALVCERCLQAANPFTSASLNWALPTVVLLVAAPLLLVTLLVLAGMRVLRSRRQTLQLAVLVRARATRTSFQGTSVLLVNDPEPVAFTLPARLGGIVLSKSVIDGLEADELASVLAHERAHLEQGHHLTCQLLDAVVAPLRWVPLISALCAALGECMEVAADDIARRQVGTKALASALLKLGAPPGSSGNSGRSKPAILNAAGPGRIAHLVGSRNGSISRWPVLALAACLAALGTAAAGVSVPYLALAISGCL